MKKFFLWFVLIILSIGSLFVGVQSIDIRDIFHLNETQSLVLWSTRVPRTVSLIIAGASTSICGLVMQQLTQNKFVSPTTAGTMDSARLGILLAMLLLPNSGSLVKSSLAFFFAFLGTMLFIRLLQTLPAKNSMMVPLIGLMFGNIIGSIVTFFAYQWQVIQNLSSWLQGNFATVSRNGYELIYLSVPLLVLAYVYAYQFTIVGLGKDMATNVGMNYQRTQTFGLLLISLISSIILVTVGNLPFLGIVIPNLVSIYYGDQMKQTLWLTAISGSLFLIVCDILSRVIIAPYEIPVSLIVGVIGSLLFIFLLVRGDKQHA